MKQYCVNYISMIIALKRKKEKQNYTIIKSHINNKILKASLKMLKSSWITQNDN
jgi:hypothetical protein